jgi:hypothetical protein
MGDVLATGARVSARAVTLAGYAVLVLTMAAWQAASLVRGSLTLDQAVRFLLRRPAVRALFVLGWAWLGWHLFARGSAGFLG